MGKDGGFLTPKAISNRIKAKGLQKLRWYCQMCQKQCRDENGMRCHMKSEGHLRAMRVFAENPNRVLSEFSQLFLKGFLDTLSHRHGTKRVLCNTVYQEYISYKEHVHMNATCWSSLTGLCKYLGREGKCVVDETEKGWYIQYIDKDPNLIAKQAAMDKQHKADLNEEERTRRMIAAQVAAANENSAEEGNDEKVSHDLIRNNDSKLEIKFEGKRGSILKSSLSAPSSNGKLGTVKPDTAFHSAAETSSKETFSSKKPLSNIDALIAETEKRKASEEQQDEKANRKDYWLAEGIVVKIMNKKVGGGKYYKEKGTVVKVIDRYVGEVRLDDSTRIRLDQEDLETVIPKIGKKVLILNGRCRGQEAELLRINEREFNCDLRVISSSATLHGKEVKGVEYEDLSKLA